MNPAAQPGVSTNGTGQQSNDIQYIAPMEASNAGDKDASKKDKDEPATKALPRPHRTNPYGKHTTGTTDHGSQSPVLSFDTAGLGKHHKKAK